MTKREQIEIPVKGIDCAHCAQQIEGAVSSLPGVESVNISLSSDKVALRFDPSKADLGVIQKTIEAAGGSIPVSEAATPARSPLTGFTRRVLTLFGVVFGAVLFIVVVGEWLGLFEAITKKVPWPVWLAILLVGGYPVLRSVVRATLRRRVTSHTLMTVGAVAAVAVGQWATAAIVIFFMRVGDYAEKFTTERARRAVKDLTQMAPQAARVERDGREQEVPVNEVQVGETVVVRPGEQIPVDGEVVSGHATVDQASITGESMPTELGPGSRVYASTIAALGSVRVRATQVGADTTFGRVIKLVEEAESNRGEVQRVADKFSGYYLPVVAVVAALTFIIRHDPLATAAVLVVACSCSFALATPIAMLASIGAGARNGLLVKGGKYLETLADVDVVLLDKTGTLTLGRPRVSDVVPLNGLSEADVLVLAASAERYSEHPLAEAVRTAARERKLPLQEPELFEAVPGHGVRAHLNGSLVAVGNPRMISTDSHPAIQQFESEGKTMLLVAKEGQLVGILAATDTLRPEVPTAISGIRQLGIKQIELLTGDNERTAAALATPLGLRFRANLLPHDKIAVVKEYQAAGHKVMMVGDGINDAPALAQADVGVAMGAAGSDVAIETAHAALMREDWMLVPVLVATARRTMRVVRLNIGFTAIYNLGGLALAALGFLPPIFAAAAQALPDLIILGNSSRLLRTKQEHAIAR